MKKALASIALVALMYMMGAPYYGGGSGWYMAGSQGNDVPPGSLFSSCSGCAYYGGYQPYGGYGGGYGSGYGNYSGYGYPSYGYNNYGYTSGSPMVNAGLPYLGYPIYSGYGYGGGWYL